MKKTLLTIVLAALCLILTTKAQQVTNLSGRIITSPDSQPLPGATIKIKESGAGVLSNNDGAFSIQTSLNEGTLVISYLGYQTKEILFSSRDMGPFEIFLQESAGSLKEIEINAGYYTVKDRERTGSISRVTAETIGKQPVANPLLALQGSAAGVFIQQSSGIPGTSVNVQIRGTNSIAAGNNPYYIVDGVPFVSQSLSSVLSSGLIYGNTGSSPLNVLNPNDIESVEILKDADATAIYGSKGANGVVLITTKKGRAGRTVVTANLATGISNVASKLKLMNTTQYLEMRNQAFANDNVAPGTADHDMNGNWDKNRYTDWQKELIGGTAHFNNAQLSMSGGNAATQILLSGNYQYQSNVFPGSQSYRKYSTHLSGSHKALEDKLIAAFSIIYSRDKNDQIFSDLTQSALSLSPNAPALHTADGKINWENSTWINPLRELESKFLAVNDAFIGNLNLSYQILKNLTIKSNLGYNDNRLSDRSFTPSTYYDPAAQPTAADAFSDFNESKLYSWIVEPQLDYQTQIGRGKLTATLGTTFQSQVREQMLMRGSGFSSDALITNLKAAATISIRDNQATNYKYQAVYGRLNYNYDNRYILNLTGRRDGSSRFGPGKQFANFGAIGAAWVFSNEPVFRPLTDIISSGKLRATYGLAGNDQIGDYEYLDIFSSSSGYNGKAGLTPARLFNRDLAWEVNKKAEIGLELGFVNDRLSFSATYYQNRSSNQLVQYALPGTTGFPAIRKNLDAVVQNTGLELELNSVNLNSGKLKWSSGVNLSVPRNKLVDFPDLAASTYASQYVIGKPLSVRKFYQYKGINESTGLYEVVDANGDGKITALEDQQTLVNASYHAFGGLKNNLSYGGFQFGCLFYFVSQTYYDYFVSTPAPGRMYQQTPDVLNSNRQKFTAGSNPLATVAYSYFIASDEIIRKSYYIRLKNIDVSYQFKFAKGLDARVYMQGQNLFTITNFTGLDPETYNALPMLRTVTLGAQITF